MRLSDFEFDLPDACIALRPAEPRESARLLVVDPRGEQSLRDHCVGDLPGFLRPGDVLVFNDTRVIPARIDGVRHRGDLRAEVEITLHKRERPGSWRVFAKPGKRLAAGDVIHFDGFKAEVAEKTPQGDVLLTFDLAAAALDGAIARAGVMPLPPYIAQRRPTDAADLTDYQTIYAARDGAVAAPTAGLHFTPDLMARIDNVGCERRHVTLHVGAGTFLPVKVEDVAAHRMHAEWGEIGLETADAINAARARGGRVIAVGTTALRLLESAADADGRIRPFSGDTSIFLTPGYRFRAVDVLMTNFHLPKSTLFMLVSAFSGLPLMRAAYAHAISSGYRFYSYGDASLLFRAA
jgi:S-adenosylmethionine:tRNA ribosyltransferase-isomerase